MAIVAMTSSLVHAQPLQRIVRATSAAFHDELGCGQAHLAVGVARRGEHVAARAVGTEPPEELRRTLARRCVGVREEPSEERLGASVVELRERFDDREAQLAIAAIVELDEIRDDRRIASLGEGAYGVDARRRVALDMIQKQAPRLRVVLAGKHPDDFPANGEESDPASNGRSVSPSWNGVCWPSARTAQRRTSGEGIAEPPEDEHALPGVRVVVHHAEYRRVDPRGVGTILEEDLRHALRIRASRAGSSPRAVRRRRCRRVPPRAQEPSARHAGGTARRARLLRIDGSGS